MSAVEQLMERTSYAVETVDAIVAAAPELSQAVRDRLSILLRRSGS